MVDISTMSQSTQDSREVGITHRVKQELEEEKQIKKDVYNCDDPLPCLVGCRLE